MRKICGFVVVRFGKLNFRGREYSELIPPHVDGIYYGGIERLDWFDIDNERYSGTLPVEYKLLYEQLDNTSTVSLIKKLDIAKKLLDFSNRKKQLNEIIAIYSKGIEATYGSFISEREIHWRGEDVVCWMGSMLREGIFTKPHLFIEFKNKLNKYGLFDINSQVSDLYVEHYSNLSAQGHVLEDFSNVMSSLDKIWIGEFKT